MKTIKKDARIEGLSNERSLERGLGLGIRLIMSKGISWQTMELESEALVEQECEATTKRVKHLKGCIK